MNSETVRKILSPVFQSCLIMVILMFSVMLSISMLKYRIEFEYAIGLGWSLSVWLSWNIRAVIK